MDDCTLVTIYRKRNFSIYNAGNNQFIVHNTKIEFSKGHTHIRNFSTAKFIIELSLHKSIPKHLSNYLLISLIRINTDEEYIDKLKEMLSTESIERKGTSYKESSSKKRYRNKKYTKKGEYKLV